MALCHLYVFALLISCIATKLLLSCCVGLKKWVEVGNSGVFRPEMLLPMGLPENVSVIAWGLSLERSLLSLTMHTMAEPV